MTGNKFEVGGVLSDSWNLVVRHPLIALPPLIFIAIAAIPLLYFVIEESLFESLNLQVETAGFLMLLWAVIIFIAFFLLIGAYPLIVKDAIQGDPIDFHKAFGTAKGKFFTIIGAEIVAILLTGLGYIFFIIPGLIILSLYFYRIPAIVLEDRGIMDGLSASNDFAKDKKFNTFLLYWLPSLILQILFLILSLFEGYVWLMDWILFIAYIVLSIVFFVWELIIPSFVYVEYVMKEKEKEYSTDIT